MGNVKLRLSMLYVLSVVGAGYLLPLPYNPSQPNLQEMLAPPSQSHWFGTDRLGMDVFSRTVAAAAVDVPLALRGVAISIAIAIPTGLIVSSHGRWAERTMRALDAFQVFPLVILAIVFVTLAGDSLNAIVGAIAVINAPRMIRLIRSEALVIRESRYIEAARSLGASPQRVLVRHILPNVADLIGVQAGIATAHAILVIGALSFLGVGIEPPTPSWGRMIGEGSESIISGDWWIAVFPGLALLSVVFSVNVIADGLQDRKRGIGVRGT
jgi:peptide/nickel transport system permease protein